MLYFFNKGVSFVAIFHSLLGFFGLAFFIFYSIEHFNKHKCSFSLKKQKNAKLKAAISGTLHFIITTTVVISGLVLFIYDFDEFYPWNEIHLIFGLLIIFSAMLHWLSKK